MENKCWRVWWWLTYRYDRYVTAKYEDLQKRMINYLTYFILIIFYFVFLFLVLFFDLLWIIILFFKPKEKNSGKENWKSNSYIYLTVFVISVYFISWHLLHFRKTLLILITLILTISHLAELWTHLISWLLQTFTGILFIFKLHKSYLPLFG